MTTTAAPPPPPPVAPGPLLMQLDVFFAGERHAQPDLSGWPDALLAAELQEVQRRRAADTAYEADLDHVIAHADGGATDCGNLCCLCRSHHRLKTFAPGWRFTLDADGTLHVTTPSGITRTTRPPGLRLPPAPPPAVPPPADHPAPPPPHRHW